ncbi:MAG: hypothetical protein ABIR11_07345 [Candidatus Limnocylindrales bacterium]
MTVPDAHLAMRAKTVRHPDLVHRVMDHPTLAGQWWAPLAARLTQVILGTSA